MNHAVDAEALAACSREPIHIPGAIQPHGMLLALDAPALVCRHVSANSAVFCGVAPEDFLGRPLSESAPELARAIQSAGEDPALASPLRVEWNGRPFDAMLHHHDNLLFVELEVADETVPTSHHRRLQRIFARLRSLSATEDFYRQAAQFIAGFTGFERVMIYKFDDDWHGEVVGEHLTAPVDSYLGHHFPASDIPDQARALYRKSWLRLIPDATYDPVPILPAAHSETRRPLDLSFAMLRSVSPVHLEYLRNMDVAASMSISVLVKGELWGLIACHHRTPRRLPCSIRGACELFGQVFSLELEARREASRLAEHARAATIQTRFFDVLAGEQSFVEALIKYTPSLLEFMGASGAAIHVADRTTLLGRTPTEAQTSALLAWLKEQSIPVVLATESLQKIHPPAAEFRDVASGLLAIRLSRVEPHFVLWFRPEVLTTVTWAGNPRKPVGEDQRLHPRKSFHAWKETVSGCSLPWNEAELQGAHELVQALNALVLRRTERLISLNAQLERQNTDLNSFAYIAAHDLREPLRGISRYCAFMREDHGATLPAEAHRKLDTLSALATQSEELLDALNHYSKIGRLEVHRRPVDLDATLTEALSSLRMFIEQERAEIRRPRALPAIECDPVLVREIFANLVSNGIRYNTNGAKWVEIGWKDEKNPIFYVQDNGIGIREKHYDAVFTIFRRLHAHEEFGGGTGAGLAIVKSIVDKHGGRIWIDSRPGEGSTFFFTLAPDMPA